MMKQRYSPYQRKKSSRKARATTATTSRLLGEGPKWTPEEDSVLRDGVCKFGGKKWKAISERIERRSPEECNERWNKLQGMGTLVKRPWSEAEDKRMLQLVKKYGASKWAVIASFLKGRNGKQCRERWHNQLNPTIKKTPWTEKENAIIVAMQARLGNCWAKITSQLPGRTDNSVKNHWYSSLKTLVERARGDDASSATTKRGRSKKKSCKARPTKNSSLSRSTDPRAYRGVVAVVACPDEEISMAAVSAGAVQDAATLAAHVTPLAAPIVDPVATPFAACLATAVNADHGPLSPDSRSSADNLDLHTHAQSYQNGVLRAQAVIDNILDPMGMGLCGDNRLNPPCLPDTFASLTPVNHTTKHSMEAWNASDDGFCCSARNDLPSLADPMSPAQPPFGLDELLYDPLHDVCDGGLQVPVSLESPGLVLSAPLGEVARMYQRSMLVTEWGTCITYSSPSTAGRTFLPTPTYVAPNLSPIDPDDEMLFQTKEEPLVDAVKHEIPSFDCGYGQAISSCAAFSPLLGVEV
ncbi:hypothetical protein PHYPSEUDO_006504 [Phytophthora pseudosyringae]|uniref:Myb-like DNA-binding protein n=1 Tax=Phytophthora pseudosyringae TaxID=221518 RepID=A0A8T1VLP4_9STRA|nr:hypothetical protein PHYPSEUDO_006504 [Phytophthora pseudosyringae]